MRVAIIGAGAIGVTMAHVLSQSDCEVHVFEQGSSAAQGASFSQSGLLGAASLAPVFEPSYSKAWIQSLFGHAKHLQWRLEFSGKAIINHIKLMWASRAALPAVIADDLKRLIRYSEQIRETALADAGIDFEHKNGLLCMHYKGASFDAAIKQATDFNDSQTDEELKIKILSPEQVFAQEPSLVQHGTLAGGVFYPSNTYGNCALFIKQLKLQHQGKKVIYHFNNTVMRLESVGIGQWRVYSWLGGLESGKSHAILNAAFEQTMSNNKEQGKEYDKEQSPNEPIMSQLDTYDAVVIAAGAGSASLLSRLNINYPVLNLHAYNVTLPIDNTLDAPQSAILDMDTRHAIVPIGNRVRVSGQVQVGGAVKQNSAAYKALNKTVQHWYPYASKVSEATYDCRSSCVAMDSKPIVGQTQLDNLYVNFAHGNLAWPLAFGCAQALADEVLQTKSIEPSFNLDAFSPQRFS